MAFGKLGALGRGFGSLGALGGAGESPVVDGVLAASGGSFVFSADSMAPIVDRDLPAAGGSYTFTGQAATLTATSSNPPVPTFRLTATTSSGSSISQAGLNIVNAAEDLLLIVGYHGPNGSDLTGTPTITPNGGGAINGTLIRSDSTNVCLALMQFAIPNGTDLTNATLACALSGAIFDNPRTSFWTVPQAELVSLTATDNKTATSASSTAASITTLATSADGMVIAIAIGGDFSATNTWSGTEANLPTNERYDTPAGTAWNNSGTDVSGTGASAGSTVTATMTVSGVIRVTAASWR
jgi:hypothetical protein